MEITQTQYKQLKDKGLADAEIARLAKLRGYRLPGERDDGGLVGKFTSGAIKGLIGDVARPTAQMVQGLGQRAIATFTPATLSEVRGTTGLKSLDDTTTEGRGVVESLTTHGGAETTGRVVANIASFFIPTSPATVGLGRLSMSTGRLVNSLGIGLSKREAGLIQAYKAQTSPWQRIVAALKGTDETLTLDGRKIYKPRTSAQSALDNKVFWSESVIGIKAKKAGQRIWREVIAPGLQNIKEKVNMKDFTNELEHLVDSTTPELTRKKELLDAVAAFADDYKNVGEISYEKLQKFKEGWTKFLPDKAWKGKPIANSFKEIQNMAGDLARGKIYKALEPELGQAGKVAYIDYSNMLNLQALGQISMTGSKLKGGAGSFVSGVYDIVVTPLATSAGMTLYKTGQGLQFIGAKGARILGDLFR